MSVRVRVEGKNLTKKSLKELKKKSLQYQAIVKKKKNTHTHKQTRARAKQK